MQPAAPQPVVVPADTLRRFAAALFVAADVPPDEAAVVADVLVWANLRGQDGHGVARLPRYLQWLSTGEVHARPAINVWSDAPAMIAIDADRAFGPIAMTRATALAIDKARAAGVGLAMVRGTTHTAALGYYTESIARAGFAGIALAASVPNMAYHGARRAGVSTSPISIAVPGGPDGVVVFDMGTGVVAFGKLNQAKRAGKPIPAGWALDREGNPTTDPAAAAIPLPIAGPKGSGLALMIECLTSLAVGQAILAPELSAAKPGPHHQNGFVMAIDLARLGAPEAYRAEVDALAQAIKRLPPSEEGGEVLLPGERGYRTARTRAVAGVPVPAAIWREIGEAAAKLDVPLPA